MSMFEIVHFEGCGNKSMVVLTQHGETECTSCGSKKQRAIRPDPDMGTPGGIVFTLDRHLLGRLRAEKDGRGNWAWTPGGIHRGPPRIFGHTYRIIGDIES